MGRIRVFFGCCYALGRFLGLWVHWEQNVTRGGRSRGQLDLAGEQIKGKDFIKMYPGCESPSLTSVVNKTPLFVRMMKFLL